MDNLFDQWNEVKKQTSKDDFFFNFEFLENKTSTAILIQTRLFSSKRLLNKIGVININDYEKLKEKYLKLLQ